MYFNADASLSAVPDTVFFSELHAALPPNHRKQLKAIYVVHPSALLKTWVWILRLQEPEVYTKVRPVNLAWVSLHHGLQNKPASVR